MFDRHESGASRKLHAIEAGGHALLIIARQRIAKMLNAMEEGDFLEAHSAATNLTQTLGVLANAEKHIAIAKTAKLLKARELEPGMTLSEVGELTDVAVTECSLCDGHVTAKVGEHEFSVSGKTELYVSEPRAADA